MEPFSLDSAGETAKLGLNLAFMVWVRVTRVRVPPKLASKSPLHPTPPSDTKADQAHRSFHGQIHPLSIVLESN